MQEPQKVRAHVLPTSDADEVIILIHGYNNSLDKADRSYQRFQDLLRHCSVRGSERLGPFWEFHWPGDHPLGVISLATYACRIPDAGRSGDRLAAFLAKKSSSQTIHLVAHSLGCRVALSAIAKIRELQADEEYAGARIGQVFLLAAAVSERLCERKESRPFSASFEYSREHVFFSGWDAALRAAPFGQYFYGERGQAVGRKGMPQGRWATQFNTGLGHSEYWTSPSVAQDIAATLLPGSWKPKPKRLVGGQGRDVRELESLALPSRSVERRVA